MNFSYLKPLSESKYFRTISIIVFCGLVIISALLTFTTPKPPKVFLSSKSSNYIYTAKSKNFSAKIGAKESNIPVITFETRKGASATFALANSKPEKVTRSGNSVTFKNTLPDTDLVYSTLVNGLKEEIILNKATGVNEYIFNLNTQNAKPIKNGKDSYSTSFFDERNNLQFYIEKPFAIDAKGSRTEDVQIYVRKSAEKSDEYQLKLVVSPSWLNAKDRAYPVSIDPTLIYDTTAEFATGIFNRVRDTQQTVLATGGTITYSGGYTIHTFTTSGTFTPLQSMNVEALVVAGGGGGGGYGGGGGGGGIQYSASLPVTAQAYTITVGNGGGGGNGASNTWTQGSDGTNSVFSTLTAVGGGGGGGYNTPNGRNGGSGGGAANSSGSIGTGSQGYNGGTGSHSFGSYTSSGGGGGAGAVGSNASGGVSGNGGTGASYSISGSSVTYGGGGGGGGINSSAGSGGNGGGGNGATGAGANGSNGTANTGGGGGGNSGNGGVGGTGGSGVVIIRYPSNASLETYYQELPADQYTIGLWHFNNSWSDSSGNAYTYTAYGNSTFSTTNILGSHSATFDGTGDYALTGNYNQAANAPFTVEGWVYLNANSTNNNGFVGHTQQGDQGWIIDTGVSGSTNMPAFYTQTGGYLRSPVALSLNKWHHLAATFDNGVKILYIDGVEVARATGAAYSALNIPFTIGRFYYNNIDNYYLNGNVDEVRISNIARSPEEIKLSASRRPYSVYTSDIIDLTMVGSWNPLTWSELGVNTGDGETVKDATGLVAQWNFNETSGTTADNAQGTAALDGTLTNFASTGSQDAAVGTGWTANNKKWGAGALMFDGSNDYVSVSDNSSLTLGSSFSIETWVNMTSLKDSIFVGHDNGGGNVNKWLFVYDYNAGIGGTANTLALHINSAATPLWITTPWYPSPGKWYHLVVTRSGGSAYTFYVNGVAIGTATNATAIPDPTASLTIGQAEGIGYTNGVIDSTRIYSRALSAAEILSNYQAGNIEVQTRVGSDSTPDDGSWEEWRPVTGEAAVLSFDTSITDSLASFWKFEEGANGVTRYDSWGKNNLTDSATVTTTTGIQNSGVSFASASLQSVLCTDANCGGLTAGKLDFNASQDFTYGGWMKTSTTGVTQTIMGKKNVSTTVSAGYTFHLSAANIPICRVADGTNQAVVNTAVTVTDGNWHHVLCVVDRTAQTITRYVDGVASSPVSTSAVGSLDQAQGFRIGTQGSNAANFYNGVVDEIGVWRRALSASEVTSLYASGAPKKNFDDTDLTNNTLGGGLYSTSNTATKVEGTASQKIETGKPQVDGSTVALWHMDETGGTGAYTKDSSSNANNLTPTSTTVAQGISGKAQLFSGGSQYLTNSSLSSSLAGDMTIQTWFKTGTTPNTQDRIVDVAQAAARGLQLSMSTTGTVGIDNSGGPTSAVFSSATYLDNKWHHLAVTRSGTTYTVYVDGASIGTSGGTAPTYTQIFFAREYGDELANWAGSIDETKLSNIARSADEIAEAYRAGRDHYLNKTISSTDLSAKTSLPFYVAADRPGTYLQAIVGESAYANYQPDTNTVGLWHLDEQSGSSAYVKDISGNGNNLTPTGTTFTKGQIGSGRNFNGTTSHYLQSASSNSWNLNNNTISLWVNPTAYPGAAAGLLGFCGYGTSCGGYGGWDLRLQPSGVLNLNYYDSGSGAVLSQVNTSQTIPVGKWSHISVTISGGTSISIYINGQLSTTATFSSPISRTTTLEIGTIKHQNCGGAVCYTLNGLIDEVRIDNTVRTADQIRQAYEVGSRTHTVTIDFGAKLDSGNLITASNDLGFTVDATYYGLQSKGSMLFKGDKIIVRENYDGTEYIAQGTVDSVNVSTGATTVSSWDAASTFPASGFTANASVFKWQREYWSPTGSLSTHRDAITNLTLRLTDGNEGRTIWIDDLKASGGYLTNPLGSTITSSTANRYFQYRTILTSNDNYVSPTLPSLTIDYTNQNAPSTPTLNAPADTSINQITSTVLQTTTTDSESDYLRYKIQLCTNVGMSANCQIFDQTNSQTGWSGQNTQTNTAYTSGTQATYTIQTPLSAGTTYYWRSYAIDPAGLNVWSNTQGAPYSFTTQFATATTNGTIDNADSTDWVSSDITNTPNSLETTIKQEGTGSIKVLTGNDSISSFDLMEYSNDSNAQSTYVTNGNNTATGGTITTSGSYTIHTFTSSGTFNPSQSMNTEYLVVAGGGGGGSTYVGSGGGAGGMRTGNLTVTSGSKTVTVGNGGPAQTQGQNSVFDSITSIGGGGGVSISTGTNGGSGSGGSYGAGGGAGYLGGTATAGQGNDGGKGWYSVGVSVASGGGGGAGAVGQNGNGTKSGNGGDGLASSISGVSVTYAGGGGGGPWSTNGIGTGGAGGGGNGGHTGVAGTPNTGGGGGGGGTNGTPVGGAGGSGIVIVRYLSNVLQSYSEATIKSQGSYSLKGVAVATESLNKTLTRTINSPINLSNRASFSFDIRSNRTGSNIKIGLHDAGGVTTEITPNISQADAFQTATIDLSGVINANKDAIDQIIITIVNADALNTFYIDNMVTSNLSVSDTVTKTTSYYNLSSVANLTFWIRSTVAGSYIRFGFGEAAATEQYTDITINQANNWEQVIWDISGISAASRDGVTKFAFTVTGNTSGATFYFDNIGVNDLTAPTIGAATALSSTSIRWGFTDTTSTENGFKVYTSSNIETASCGTSNISSCDETGLTPNTSYTRKVAAYTNAYGSGRYSNTATKYTLAATPPSPFTFDRTNTAIKIGLNDGTNPAGTQYAIYKESNYQCDGSGGSYLAANGSDNGSTAVWQSRAQWGALSATGLSKESIYSFCVKARNGENVETAFGPVGVNNSGYIPLTGNAILATASGTLLTLGSKYTEGNRGSRYITGVDNGLLDNDANTASITVQDGILTINSNETLVAGKFLFTGGSLAVASNGGELRPGAPLWIKDADADGYPETDTTWFGFNNKPTGGRRRGNLSSLMTADCNDSNGSYNVTCCTANGGACSSDGTCCSGTCGTDADNDGYNSSIAAHTGTCQATVKPYTDCGDGNASAYPGSTTCSGTGFTKTASPNNGTTIYDYDCNGSQTTCGPTYYSWASSAGYGCSKCCGCVVNESYFWYSYPSASVGCGVSGSQQNGGNQERRYCTSCNGGYCCSQIDYQYPGPGTSGNQGCQ